MYLLDHLCRSSQWHPWLMSGSIISCFFGAPADRAFEAEINCNNPLGTGGRLAIGFAVLLRALWKGTHHAFQPSKLKVYKQLPDFPHEICAKYLLFAAAAKRCFSIQSVFDLRDQIFNIHSSLRGNLRVARTIWSVFSFPLSLLFVVYFYHPGNCGQ